MLMYILILVVLVLFLLLLRFCVCPRVPPFEWNKKHVFITGGSKGIGRALAVEAVRSGAHVTICARDPVALKDACDQLQQLCDLRRRSQECAYYVCDVTHSYEQVYSVVSEASRKIGPIDVLICNTGNVGVQAAIENIPEEHFAYAFKLNVVSAQWFTKAVIPSMKKRCSGRIVYVSSVAGQIGIWGYGAYSPTKFALRGLAETAQMELNEYGIRVTVVYPPNTDTEGYQDEKREMPTETRAISDSGGLCDPKEVAKGVLHSVKHGHAASTFGVEGWLVGVVTSGMCSETSVFKLLIQSFAMGPARFISAFVQRQFAYQIHQIRKKK